MRYGERQAAPTQQPVHEAPNARADLAEGFARRRSCMRVGQPRRKVGSSNICQFLATPFAEVLIGKGGIFENFSTEGFRRLARAQGRAGQHP